MKLTKISLATLVALGAFSSVASATPLEEAIKNVDLSGFARYRYENVRERNSAGLENVTDSKHRFRSIFTFKAALDDNFFGVLSLRYDSNDGSGKAGNVPNVTDTTSSFGVQEFYLGYTVGNTTVTAGKQVIGTYLTDDEAGTGIKIVNNDISGLTLAAIAFDALEDSYETNVLYPTSFATNNLYGVAAIGSYDPVSFQLWYASLVNVVDIIAADLGFSFDISDDVNIGATVNYAHSSADSDIAVNNYKDTDFYAVELKTGLFGADLSAGYIGWKVKDRLFGIVSLEDQGSYISPAEQFLDYTTVEGKGTFWFVTAGYQFDKFGVGADYLKGDVKYVASKEKVDEIVGRLSYDYSAKLKFNSYYSNLTVKSDTGKEKTDKIRFEAKYSF